MTVRADDEEVGLAVVAQGVEDDVLTVRRVGGRGVVPAKGQLRGVARREVEAENVLVARGSHAQEQGFPVQRPVQTAGHALDCVRDSQRLVWLEVHEIEQVDLVGVVSLCLHGEGDRLSIRRPVRADDGVPPS